MKKLAIILSFLMLVPGAAFGLEMMNDGAMDDVTGQAGVSIIADDVQLFMNIERMAWIDTDGFADSLGNPYGDTATGSGGAVGLSNFQIDVMTINAITNTVGGSEDAASTTANLNLGSTEAGALDLNWDYDSDDALSDAAIATDGDNSTGGDYSGPGYGTYAAQTKGLDNYDPAAAGDSDANFKFAAITIDATSQLPAATEAFSYMASGEGSVDVNIGGVMIGLPTLEVYIPSMSMTPAFYNLDPADAAQAINDIDGTTAFDAMTDGANYGTIEMEGITFSVLSGWVEIAPH